MVRAWAGGITVIPLGEINTSATALSNICLCARFPCKFGMAPGMGEGVLNECFTDATKLLNERKHVSININPRYNSKHSCKRNC